MWRASEENKQRKDGRPMEDKVGQAFAAALAGTQSFDAAAFIDTLAARVVQEQTRNRMLSQQHKHSTAQHKKEKGTEAQSKAPHRHVQHWRAAAAVH